MLLLTEPSLLPITSNLSVREQVSVGLVSWILEFKSLAPGDDSLSSYVPCTSERNGILNASQIFGIDFHSRIFLRVLTNGKNVWLVILPESARPKAVRVLPASVLPILVHIPHTPGLVPTGLCVSNSAFRVPLLPDRAHVTLFCAKPRGLLDPCGARPHPAAGHPDAFPRGPLTRAALPAASPQALRAPHDPGASVPRLSSLLFLTASHPRVWIRECISRPRLRRSWRSRRRPPLRHTGLTALPCPLRGQRLRR